MKRILYATLLVTALALGQAKGAVITFDDLPFPTGIPELYYFYGSDPLPSSYAGFTWNTAAAYYNKTSITGGAYPSCVVSGNQALFTALGASVSFSAGGIFNFESAYIAAPWQTHEVTVTGFRAGTQIYSQEITAIYGKPQNFTFNFNGVDQVVIDPQGRHITMDDVSVSAVPDSLGYIVGDLALVLPFALHGVRTLRTRKQAA